jgi:hypothetical protein
MAAHVHIMDCVQKHNIAAVKWNWFGGAPFVLTQHFIRQAEQITLRMTF